MKGLPEARKRPKVRRTPLVSIGEAFGHRAVSMGSEFDFPPRWARRLEEVWSTHDDGNELTGIRLVRTDNPKENT